MYQDWLSCRKVLRSQADKKLHYSTPPDTTETVYAMLSDLVAAAEGDLYPKVSYLSSETHSSLPALIICHRHYFILGAASELFFVLLRF